MKADKLTSYNTPNSTPRMAALTVEAMKRYQDLGRDIEMLRIHLAAPERRGGTAARIAACQLSAHVLGQALTTMLITELSDEP